MVCSPGPATNMLSGYGHVICLSSFLGNKGIETDGSLEPCGLAEEPEGAP